MQQLLSRQLKIETVDNGLTDFLFVELLIGIVQRFHFPGESLHISRLNEDVFAGVKERAAYIRKELTGAPGVKSITGLGLMIGILPEHKTAADVASACLQDGLMVLTAHEKVRLLPPLNISYEDLAAGLAILKKHLA